MAHCPCGSKLEYGSCCGLYISGVMTAPTPEALMRSRYSAYTQGNIDYIQRTMAGPAAQGFDPKSAKEWAQSVRWMKLEVLSSHMEGDKGEVTFKAHYTLKGKAHILSERSAFQYIEGQWKYFTRY